LKEEKEKLRVVAKVCVLLMSNTWLTILGYVAISC